MGVTNFPNGISFGMAAGGTVQLAAGTVVVPAGSGGTAFATGLSSVAYVQATPYSTVVTVAGFEGVVASSPGGGSVLLIGVSGAGTVSTANGTATWVAFGS